MTTVVDVSVELMRHPVRSVIHQWHWKSATLSAVIRGSLFFAANLTDGAGAAARAAAVESALAAPMVGVLAAAIQAYRCAEPRWAATLVTAALIPVLAQIVECAVHWSARTPQFEASMLASIGLSAISTAFNLFAMRRGVMIVGSGARRFRDDLRQIPRLVVAFVLALPRSVARRCAPQGTRS
jgi:hypothetical protein